MLLIHHKGIHVSLPLDTTNFTGDVEADSKLPYVTGLVGGALAAIDANGVVQLADGDPAKSLLPLGFLVNDAAGYFFMNKPAIAGKEVAITHSPCMISTDQVKTGQTFTPGQKVYCGTGADAGKVVNAAPAATARPIGIALTDFVAQGDVMSGSLSVAPGVPMLKILVGSIAD
jgi:hypothetical protein